MAEKKSLPELQAAYDELQAQIEQNRVDEAAQARKKKETELKQQAEQIKKEAKDREKELKEQFKGPDFVQMGADLGGLVLGEGLYRLIALALKKLGVNAAWVYTVPSGLVGTAMYAVFYPKKNEGAIRATLRAFGNVMQIVSLHDGITFAVASSSDNKAQMAQQLQQNQQLQQQLAQYQAQAQAAAGQTGAPAK